MLLETEACGDLQLLAPLDATLTPLISTRVILYRPDDPLKIIVREAEDKAHVVLVGGKLNYFPIETLLQGIRREVKEETTFSLELFNVLAVLPVGRFVKLDESESRHLGRLKRGQESWGLVTSELLCTAAISDSLPEHPVEGRMLQEINLAKRLALPFKKRHLRAVELYRSWAKTKRIQLSRAERQLTTGFRSAFVTP